jgi:hypothetical protein
MTGAVMISDFTLREIDSSGCDETFRRLAGPTVGIE